MSSGEADAVSITIKGNIPTGDNYFSPSITEPNYYWTTGSSTNLNWTTTIYKFKYQIRCPFKTCKTYNWLELDTITPCTSCGLKLKAVSEQADFEIEVTA